MLEYQCTRKPFCTPSHKNDTPQVLVVRCAGTVTVLGRAQFCKMLAYCSHDLHFERNNVAILLRQPFDIVILFVVSPSGFEPETY